MHWHCHAWVVDIVVYETGSVLLFIALGAKHRGMALGKVDAETLSDRSFSCRLQLVFGREAAYAAHVWAASVPCVTHLACLEAPESIWTFRVGCIGTSPRRVQSRELTSSKRLSASARLSKQYVYIIYIYIVYIYRVYIYILYTNNIYI